MERIIILPNNNKKCITILKVQNILFVESIINLHLVYEYIQLMFTEAVILSK